MTTTTGADNAAVRDDPPEADDFGLVVRPIFGGGGALPVAPPTVTGAETSVAASAISTPLLAANATRMGFSIRNMSGSAYLYIRCVTAGGGATPTNGTAELVPGAYYEDPYRYVGVVEGIWTGVINPGDAAVITEYVPI